MFGQGCLYRGGSGSGERDRGERREKGEVRGRGAEYRPGVRRGKG